MRILFVSYEYPPDTGFGGIATYTYQIAHLFSQHQIHTEVICGSAKENAIIKENDFLTIHKIQCNSLAHFNQLLPSKLSEFKNEKIDLIEAPDYGGHGVSIKKCLPQIPLVSKLHTPSYLVQKLNCHYFNKPWYRKIKNYLKPYRFANDPEYKSVIKSDFIISPSLSLIDIVATDWQIPAHKILHVPNLYVPKKELLKIPYDTDTKKVLYLGRLETRKGVYNLSKAVAIVARQFPDAEFIFVGGDCNGPLGQSSMKEVLLENLGDHSSKVNFINHVPLESIHHFFGQCDVCVFPSLWENFPNVCLEAMSAARGIVASRNGGMNDMLYDINGGVLIDPHDVDMIAGAIISLLRDNKMRQQMGIRCREKIERYYSGNLLPDIINIYKRFIAKNAAAAFESA